MDSGTNAIDILTGRIYPLKLGFIGVVNRSQQDINEDKPMEEAMAAEEDFFRSHPAYRLIAHRCGTRYLTKTLNTVRVDFFASCCIAKTATIGTPKSHSRQVARSESQTQYS
jgi:dynamin 1-like protein